LEEPSAAPFVQLRRAALAGRVGEATVLRVLLVDDVERDREFLREALIHRGAAVMEAASDAEAREAMPRARSACSTFWSPTSTSARA
jgi:response regulator RpfG family c-di-GMP phosphodiesterase